MKEKTHINLCPDADEASIFTLSEHTDTTVFYGVNNANMNRTNSIGPLKVKDAFLKIL